MIAKFGLALPFWLAIPEGIQVKVYSYEDEGYLVTVYPPTPSDMPPSSDNAPDEVKIDGKQAFLANALNIEFHRESFDRTVGADCDPPIEVIDRAVESFISRLRYVTRGAQIRLKTLDKAPWRLRYLNDDRTELPQQEGFARGRACKIVRVSITGINNDVWEAVHELSPDWRSPTWDDLILDAFDSLPHVGTAVVLGATSLEVFAQYVVDKLAEHVKFPPSIWKWINERGNFLKDPGTDEQFDALLKHFAGKSLKENQELWQAFANIRTARNKFVHEGVATIGGKLVSAEEANALLAKALAIIKWVRELLPEDIRWPEFKINVETQTYKQIIGPGAQNVGVEPESPANASSADATSGSQPCSVPQPQQGEQSTIPAYDVTPPPISPPESKP